MKKLIRRLSRVVDSSSPSSSHYCLLRSESPSISRSSRFDSFRIGKLRLSKSSSGTVPVFVGEEMQRFVVNAELLNHPIFVKLLNKSAQEYGYEQKGVLRIPCHVLVFERILDSLRDGDDSAQDLVNLFSDEFL